MEWLYIFAWIGFALAAARTAETRGRSRTLWFVVGFLLGPIGWLLAYGQSGDRQALETRASEDTKKCPFCAERIKREANVCRYCGRDLYAKPSTADPSKMTDQELARHMADEDLRRFRQSR